MKLLVLISFFFSLVVLGEDVSISKKAIDLMEGNNLSGFEELLKTSADKFSKDETSSLITAIAGKKTKDVTPFMKTLLSYKKIDSNTLSEALSLSLYWGNTVMSRYLIKNGADVNHPNNNKVTPLMWSAFRSDYTTVKMLVEKGADINAEDMDERNVLEYAILFNREDLVVLFVSLGIKKLSTKDFDGINMKAWDALCFNLGPFNCDKIRKMHCSKCDKNKESDSKYKDFLLLDVLKKGDLKKAESLIVEKKGIDAMDANGDTPLHIAVRKNLPNIAKLLLKNGADIYTTNNSAKNPIIEAVYNNNIKMIEVLRPFFFDINSGFFINMNPLMIAAINNSLDMVKFLIEKLNADIEKTSFDNLSPLSLAIDPKNEKLVQYLLEKGAKADKTVGYDRTIHSLALKTGNKKIIEMIEKKIEEEKNTENNSNRK